MRTKVSLFISVLFLLVSCQSVAPEPSQSPSLSPAPTPSQPHSISPTPSSSATVSKRPASTAMPTSAMKKRTVALYYAGQAQSGLFLYREFRAIPSTPDTGLNSLRYLLSKGQKSFDPDYKNFWGNGSVVHYIKYKGNVATVDLSVARLNLNAASEERAVDQLVWTLTANHPTTKFIRFTSGARQFQSFSGFVDATKTFSRQLHYSVLAPVWVDQPRSVMSNPVTITGTACTFEAGLHWVLMRNAQMVRDGHAQAAIACPNRSKWSVSLGNLKTGMYTFIAQDISAKDGAVTQEDSKDFQVK